MIQLYEEPSVYEHTIHYDEEKQTQIRVTVNTFRGIEYLHVRKYYMDFEEEWKPTPEGVAMPVDFNNARELFRALRDTIFSRVERNHRRRTSKTLSKIFV